MTYINVILFFIIALIYSAAGFGGGSLYLAILSESGYSPQSLSTIALICNLIVTSIGLTQFAINKEVPWRRAAPFIFMSIPFSFWAGQWKLERDMFFLILASALFLAAVAMYFGHKKVEVKSTSNKTWLISPFIGILSGITGIGGGIYLAPILYLVNWDKPRQIAATACLFIFTNSISGLIARLFKYNQLQVPIETWWLASAVVIGGFIGSKWNNKIAKQQYIRFATIIVLLIASIKILLDHI